MKRELGSGSSLECVKLAQGVHVHLELLISTIGYAFRCERALCINSSLGGTDTTDGRKTIKNTNTTRKLNTHELSTGSTIASAHQQHYWYWSGAKYC